MQFVQMLDSVVTSGLLAGLSGNAFKVLSVLAVAARPLGGGGAWGEARLADLVADGVVTAADRGRLFCCVSHARLARHAGVSKNTLSRCTEELHAAGAIEKRRVSTAGGARLQRVFRAAGVAHGPVQYAPGGWGWIARPRCGGRGRGSERFANGLDTGWDRYPGGYRRNGWDEL